MLRRKLAGMLALVFICAASLAAQVKEMPRNPVKVINEPKIVDINTAPESDIVAVGIERTVAKKIVEGRPYRNKRDLLTKQLLTKDQYEKFTDVLIAKRPKKAGV